MTRKRPPLTEEQVKNRRKWTRLLRSKKFPQGRHQLVSQRVDAFEYCCLGVAAVGIFGRNAQSLRNRNTCFLSREEATELGLSKSDQNYLAKLNDGHHGPGLMTDPQSFEEIADWITADTKARKA